MRVWVVVADNYSLDDVLEGCNQWIRENFSSKVSGNRVSCKAKHVDTIYCHLRVIFALYIVIQGRFPLCIL